MRLLSAAIVSIFIALSANAQQPPVAEANSWLTQASLLRGEKNWRGLLEHADRWIRLFPGSAEAWNAKSEAYLQLGQPLLAEAPAKEAIRLKPDFAEAWANLAFFQATYSDFLFGYVETTRSAHEAIRLKQDYPLGWLALGIAEHRGGKRQAAVDAFKEAIRIDPSYAPAWRHMAIELRDLGRYGEATDAFNNAIRLRPGDGRALYGLGLVYAKLGQRKKVQEVYEQLMSVEPQLANQFFDDVVLHPK